MQQVVNLCTHLIMSFINNKFVTELDKPIYNNINGVANKVLLKIECIFNLT